ncbi:aldehyde dehydrogenase family protein [Rhizobium cauense]|uniref:aldehyde dehydrogenase family protein n=1 Tax=Rhizobium cauense TaxID=1166683 RepID=UPI003B83561E
MRLIDSAYIDGAVTSLARGSVLINAIRPDLLAPFGGVKQSGVGREFGVGLEAFLEPKTEIIG